MELLYSYPKNVPYILFDDKSKLSFPLTIEEKQGWKWLAFNGKIKSSLKVSKGNGSSYVSVIENVSFITDVGLTAIDKRVRDKKGVLSPITLSLLKKLFKKVSKNGYIDRKGIVIIEETLRKMKERDKEDEN